MAAEAETPTLERSRADAEAASCASRGDFQSGYAAQLDEAEIIRQFVPMVKRLALRASRICVWPLIS